MVEYWKRPNQKAVARDSLQHCCKELLKNFVRGSLTASTVHLFLIAKIYCTNAEKNMISTVFPSFSNTASKKQMVPLVRSIFQTSFACLNCAQTRRNTWGSLNKTLHRLKELVIFNVIHTINEDEAEDDDRSRFILKFGKSEDKNQRQRRAERRKTLCCMFVSVLRYFGVLFFF